jgi:PEGA domain-containing protein
MSSAIANRAWVVLVALVLAIAPARSSRAQDSKAMAQALFEEARRLMKDGKFSEACPKLAESQRLDPGLGTKLNLALCHEGEGKIATAWSEFKEAQGQARKESDQKREQFATDHIAKLEPQLSRVAVQVASGSEVAGLEVTIDGTLLGRSAWGMALPIDPGVHTLAASAPNYERWETQFTVEPGATSSTVEVPALTPGPPPAPAPPSPVPGGLNAQPQPLPPPAMPPAGDQPQNDGSVQRIAGFVVGGVGIAAAIVGIAFGAAAISKEDEADELCGGDGTSECPTDEGVNASEAAQTDALLSNIFLFGGIGLVGVGLVVVLTAPSGGDDGTTATLRPLVGPGAAGADLRVRF